MKLGPSALFFRDLYGKTLVSEFYFSHVLEGKHCTQDKPRKRTINNTGFLPLFI